MKRIRLGKSRYNDIVNIITYTITEVVKIYHKRRVSIRREECRVVCGVVYYAYDTYVELKGRGMLQQVILI